MICKISRKRKRFGAICWRFARVRGTCIQTALIGQGGEMGERFSILIEDTGEIVRSDGRENVLRAMEVLGRKGIPVGCRGGGCGVCKVQVVEGQYHTRKMSRACISEQEERDGIVLACRLLADSDLRLRVVGKMLKAVCAGTSAVMGKGGLPASD